MWLWHPKFGCVRGLLCHLSLLCDSCGSHLASGPIKTKYQQHLEKLPLLMHFECMFGFIAYSWIHKYITCNNEWRHTLRHRLIPRWRIQKVKILPELNLLKQLDVFPGWLCIAPSASILGNCCHLQVQQILRRKCVKPCVLCRGWKWRQATPMKNDGSFKRQLSYFKQATLTTMCCLTLAFPSLCFLLFIFLLPSVSISGVARKDLWDWGK